MGTATGRACFITVQSFEEYAGNDQIGDGRTTKSVVKQIFQEKQVQLCQSWALWAGATSSRLEQGSGHK